ncbi:MAG: hypothetical protein NZM27_07265 [Acetobacteraceae bacterium]|nr:hypothetical protein [Acetobacteraceae bacterium]MDW8399236.1 hypothetical protein [Acetobacteraceae bacterium]
MRRGLALLVSLLPALPATLGAASQHSASEADRVRRRALGTGCLAAAVGLVLPIVPGLPPGPAMPAAGAALLLLSLALCWPASQPAEGPDGSTGKLPAALAVVPTALAASGTLPDAMAIALLSAAVAAQLLAAVLRLAGLPGRRRCGGWRSVPRCCSPQRWRRPWPACRLGRARLSSC